MHQKQNTTMMILSQITQVLTDALQSLGYPEKDIKLSPPKNPDFGDLSTNLPLILTKELKQKSYGNWRGNQRCVGSFWCHY